MKHFSEVSGVGLKNDLKTQKERNRFYIKDIKLKVFSNEVKNLNHGIQYQGFTESLNPREVDDLNGFGVLEKLKVFKFVGTLLNGKKNGFGQLKMKKLYKYRGMFCRDLKCGFGEMIDYSNRTLIKGVWKDGFIERYHKILGHDFICKAEIIENKLFGFCFYQEVQKFYIGFLDSEYKRHGLGFIVDLKVCKFAHLKNQMKILIIDEEKLEKENTFNEKFAFADVREYIEGFLTFFKESTNLSNFKKYYFQHYDLDESKKDSRLLKATYRAKLIRKVSKKLYSLLNFLLKLNSKNLIIDENDSKLKNAYFFNLFQQFWTVIPAKYQKIFKNSHLKPEQTFAKTGESIADSISISKSHLTSKNELNHCIFFQNTDILKFTHKNHPQMTVGKYKFKSRKDENGRCEVYSGEFLNNKPHGFGTMIFPDTRKYEGEWKNGKIYGIGLLSLPSGEIFIIETPENQQVSNIIKLIK